MAFKAVDQNDVRRRMINLDDLQWHTGLVLTCDRRKFLAGQLCALSCLRNFAGIHRIQTTLNRPPCRRLQALLPARAADFCHDARQAWTLPPQEITTKMVFDHRFDLAGYQCRTGRAAPFPRSQGTAAPTLFRQPLYPAPDRRPADTKLPNGVIDAIFQAVSSFKVCLDKRTQHRGPARLFSTNGNRVFAIIIHRYLPHMSVNPVSNLMAKRSR